MSCKACGGTGWKVDDLEGKQERICRITEKENKMTTKQAISDLKRMSECNLACCCDCKESINLAIKALEQMDRVKMVTEYESNKWFNIYASKYINRNELLISFAKDRGILIEEPKKVKKWIWIKRSVYVKDGLITIEKIEDYKSEDEMKGHLENHSGFGAWIKDESTMIEVNE
jgi:hypothetical protein